MFFHALTFAGSRGCCLNTRPIGNETNMCDRYSCIFHLIPVQFAVKTLLKHLIVHFLTLDFSKQNGVGCVLSNVITPSQRHNRTRRFREQKHRQNGQSGPQRFLYNNAGLSLSFFKFRPMFKQHVNLLI